MRIPKELLYSAVVIVCAAGAGTFYLMDQNRQQSVYEASAETVETAAQPTNSILTLTPAPARIKVYIAGAVLKPGVYELEAGSRVEDVLKLAGGPGENADLIGVNLAATLSDGQEVVVPEEGQAIDNQGSVAQNNTGKVNINTAEAEQLETLPGVGEVTARNIIQYRTEHGAFQSIKDIQNVTRIGEKTFDKLKDLITVN
jgi:competence protein ComEA